MRKTAESQEQYIVDSKGHKVGVLLSLGEYRRLMEDLHDLARVAERRAEEPLSLEAMRLRLQEHGLL
jgi:PHD/YefM family antitoxin component YafN of YafNO toxin-antitoxin module